MWKLLEPGEPGKAMIRLPDDDSNGEHKVHSQRKNLRANDRAPDALDGSIAATQLRTPPEQAR